MFKVILGNQPTKEVGIYVKDKDLILYWILKYYCPAGKSILDICKAHDECGMH